MEEVSFFHKVINFTNNNAGFLTLILFLISLILGWTSGIFSFLRHRPKIKMHVYSRAFNFYVSEGLSLSKKIEKGLKVKRYAFILGISLSNVGHANTEIIRYKMKYWDIDGKGHVLYSASLPEPMTFDFKKISEVDKTKIFPALMTSYLEYGIRANNKLDTGASISGVVYFNIEFFGSFKPRIDKNKNIKIQFIAEDSYGKEYKKKFIIRNEKVKYLTDYCNPIKLPNLNCYKEANK